MLFDCIWIGNKEGADWQTDSIVKWWNTSHFKYDYFGYFVRDELLFTIELTKQPWKVARKSISLSMNPSSDEEAAISIWAACLHNYFADLCCIATCALLDLSRDYDCNDPWLQTLITALIDGKPLREGATGVGNDWPLQNMEVVLLSIIRQYCFDRNNERDYRSQLDSVIEGIYAKAKPAMVSGRIYMGEGRKDLNSLKDSQLVLLCLLLKQKWSPSINLIEIIQKWGSQDDDGLRALIDLLGQWKTRLGDKGFQVNEPLYLAIRPQPDKSEDFKKTINRLITRFEQLLKRINDFREGKLREAEVDESRLQEFMQFCSKSGFVKETAEVPISLFQENEDIDGESVEHSLSITGIPKGRFTVPAMEHEVHGWDEHYDRLITAWVASSVLVNTMKKLEPTVLDVDNATAYWQQLKVAESKIRQEGHTPVLLVANHNDPSWLRDWRRTASDENRSRPEDLRFYRNKQIIISGYLGNFNEIQVYRARVQQGSSYLIAKEALRGLSFQQFEDGIYVQVSYEPDESNESLINIKVTWQFRTDVKQFESWQLRYMNIQK